MVICIINKISRESKQTLCLCFFLLIKIFRDVLFMLGMLHMVSEPKFEHLALRALHMCSESMRFFMNFWYIMMTNY